MNDVDSLIRDLVNLAPIKTWSLIVTLFGDLDGTFLTGKQMRAALEPLGIKPEAIRVALHRLKKDGWIVSEKSGREVAYQLSKRGREDTRSVYEDVYSQDGKYPRGWQVSIVRESAEVDDSIPTIRVGRHLAITPRGAMLKPEQSLEIEIPETDIPDWFQQKFLQTETIKLAEQLSECVVAFEKLEDKCNALQLVLLRLMILHHWRKMALRTVCWAHIGLLPEGELARCHRTVTGLMNRTSKIKL